MMGSRTCREFRLRRELPFEIGENCFQLCKLHWSNTRKSDSKTVTIHPAHSGFINTQRPIQSRYMKSALKLCSRLDLHVTFDLAPSARNIQSSALPLLLVARKGAAKLRGESRLNSSLIRPRLGRNGLGGLRLKERTQCFQRCPRTLP